MDECPHCGESIEPDAESCPYCGSDAETGWKSDLDYYSVELPDDGLDEDADAAGEADGWNRCIGPGLLALAVLAFIWTGLGAYGWKVALPLAFLIGCAALYRLWGRERKGSGDREPPEPRDGAERWR